MSSPIKTTLSQPSGKQYEFLEEWPGYISFVNNDSTPPRCIQSEVGENRLKLCKKKSPQRDIDDKSWLTFVVDEVKGSDSTDEDIEFLQEDSSPSLIVDNSTENLSLSEVSSRPSSPTSPRSSCNETLFNNRFILPSSSPPQRLECEKFNFNCLTLVPDKEIISNLNKNNLNLNFLPSTPESTKKFFKQKKLNLQLKNSSTKSPLQGSSKYNKNCQKIPITHHKEPEEILSKEKNLRNLNANSENFTSNTTKTAVNNKTFFANSPPSRFDLALLEVAKNRTIRRIKRKRNSFHDDKDFNDEICSSKIDFEIFKERKSQLEDKNICCGSWKPLRELGIQNKKHSFSKRYHVPYENIFNNT
ncbi:hypothetical protein HDU92_006665 [Lobulomyces angularis]|nr:hypothetical protein HDU92_006665 [Lobulomyces angularis]